MPFGIGKKADVITDESHPEGFFPQNIKEVTGRKGPVKEEVIEEKPPVKLYTKDSDVPAHMRRHRPPENPKQTYGPTIKESAKAIKALIEKTHERRAHDIMKRLKDPTNQKLIAKINETSIMKRRRGEAPAVQEVKDEKPKRKSSKAAGPKAD